MRYDEEKQYVSLHAGCLRETSMALLVKTEDGSEHWVPKSLISEDSEVRELGDVGLLFVEEWFSDKEGLE